MGCLNWLWLILKKLKIFVRCFCHWKVYLGFGFSPHTDLTERYLISERLLLCVIFHWPHRSDDPHKRSVGEVQNPLNVIYIRDRTKRVIPNKLLNFWRIFHFSSVRFVNGPLQSDKVINLSLARMSHGKWRQLFNIVLFFCGRWNEYFTTSDGDDACRGTFCRSQQCAQLFLLQSVIGFPLSSWEIGFGNWYKKILIWHIRVNKHLFLQSCFL